MCNALGGIVFNDVLCIENPAKPFTVVGPVCWNETCYNTKTVDACQAVGGQFVGGREDSTFNASMFSESLCLGDDYIYTNHESNAAWCAIPGKHTVVGPICYGQQCFKEELSAACTNTLQGTNFGDIFCLVDNSYTVIGPICMPTTVNRTNNKSMCYPEETAMLCQEIGGTSIGDIFCVVKGEYSVLGPFCAIHDFSQDVDPYIQPKCIDASLDCNLLGGTSLGNGTFCILKGQYSFLRPDIPSSFKPKEQGTTWCKSQGGMTIGSQSGIETRYGSPGCILKGKYSIVGPMTWGSYESVLFNGNDIGGNIDESNIIYPTENQYIILKGEYSVYGPSCFDETCYTSTGDCLSAGGASFGNTFCAVADDGNGKITRTSNALYNQIISTPATFMMYMLLTLVLGYID